MTANIIIFVLGVGPGGYTQPLPPASDDEIALRAAERFRQGIERRNDNAKARPRFREAAGWYDELWRRGYRDPHLTLNRANAHRLGSDLPRAIIALREGLAAARWHRQLQTALADARAAVAYPAQGDLAAQCRPTFTQTIGMRMSPFEARLMAGTLWLLTCAGLARFAMTRSRPALGFSAVALAGLALLAGLWIQDFRSLESSNTHSLVVLREDSDFRKGNADVFPQRFDENVKLPRGVEATELTRRGHWIQIQLAGGAVGWIPESAALKMND